MGRAGGGVFAVVVAVEEFDSESESNVESESVDAAIWSGCDLGGGGGVNVGCGGM